MSFVRKLLCRGPKDAVERKISFVSAEERVAKEIATLREEIPAVFRNDAERFLEQLQEIRLMRLARQPIKEEEEKLKKIAVTLDRVVDAFHAGFGLTNPNEKFFCGVTRDYITQDRRGYTKWDAYTAFQRFPCANPARDGKKTVFVFRGVIPLHVQESYVRAVSIFKEDHIQIYAPRQEYFEAPRFEKEPVMIGMIEDVPERGNLFFEIARWDPKRSSESTEKEEGED